MPRYSDEPLADLTAAGVSNAAMLEKLRIELGVPASETLAIGDGINDLEMLGWAAYGWLWVIHPLRCWLRLTKSVRQAPTTAWLSH